ncbi:transcription factor grauzone [Aedes albopictus]|uniref:C2H2-type domain-containing protein n=1 Tax=Aedes albopictus TaxID=7160 RepID=A0ABM1XW72_AEDAL
MDSSSLCLTCGQTPRKSIVISDPSKQDIALIICQHFWYQEDDLRSAIICTLCWDKVDGFHRFYQEAKQLHEQQLSLKPSAVFIKQEIEIEEPELQENVQSEEAQGEQVADEAECRFEITEIKEECGQSDSSSQKAHSSKKKVKRTEVTPEQEKAEDDFIKQHLPFECAECTEEFQKFNAFLRHMNAVHGKANIACCNLQFRSRQMLYQHVLNYSNPEAFKCDICTVTFTTLRAREQHKKNIHPLNPLQGKHYCDQCPKTYTDPKRLKQHLQEHETLGNEMPKCSICGICFRTKINLQKHITRVHTKKHSCEICSKIFAKAAQLRQHQVNMHDHVKKQCEVCNKWLKNQVAWHKHVKRHQSDGAYKCDQCEHVSVNLPSLKEHKERRHGKRNRNYDCDQCGKHYKTRLRLREHTAGAHTGEPLYRCEFCEQTFFSNANRHGHKKRAHLEQWLEARRVRYARAEEAEGDGDSMS